MIVTPAEYADREISLDNYGWPQEAARHAHGKFDEKWIFNHGSAIINALIALALIAVVSVSAEYLFARRRKVKPNAERRLFGNTSSAAKRTA